MVGPMMRKNGCTKRHGGIHGRSGVWSADERASKNGQAGGEASKARQMERISANVSDHGEKDEDEKEGENQLEDDSLSARDFCGKIGRAETGGAPHLVRN